MNYEKWTEHLEKSRRAFYDRNVIDIMNENYNILSMSTLTYNENGYLLEFKCINMLSFRDIKNNGLLISSGEKIKIKINE